MMLGGSRRAALKLQDRADELLREIAAPSAPVTEASVELIDAMGDFDEDAGEVITEAAKDVLKFSFMRGYTLRLASDQPIDVPMPDGDPTTSVVLLMNEVSDDGWFYARAFPQGPKVWERLASASAQVANAMLLEDQPEGPVFPAEVIDQVVRGGYLGGHVDEWFDLRPVYRQQQPAADEFEPPPDAEDDSVEPGALHIPRDAGPPLAVPIDIGRWLKDASLICTHNFEPYVEHVLDLITLDADALLGELPDQVDHDVVVAMSNTRFGYALRNREIQLLGPDGHVAPEDPIATLLEERWGGETTISTAVIFGVLRDVCTFNFLGGLERLFAVTPGTTAELRGKAMRRWANEHNRGEDSRAERYITVSLLEYGYALHRLFEIHPEALHDA